MGRRRQIPPPPHFSTCSRQMTPTPAYQSCLRATSNSEFVSSQQSVEGKLPHCIDDADGLGGARMSEPGLGAEQLEGGGQGLGAQRSGVGGCPTYLTAAKVARSWFPSCQSPGNSLCLLKRWGVQAQCSTGTEKESGVVFRRQLKKQAGVLGWCLGVFRLLQGNLWYPVSQSLPNRWRSSAWIQTLPFTFRSITETRSCF